MRPTGWARRSPAIRTALASALAKISNAAHQIENPTAEQNPATAHLFIINPLTGGHGWDNLFATHPATENRIAALQQLAAEMGAGRQRMPAAPAAAAAPAGAGGRAAARGAPAAAARGASSRPIARSLATREFVRHERMNSPARNRRNRRASRRAGSRPTSSKACCAAAARSTTSSTAAARIRAGGAAPSATARWRAGWSRRCCAGSARCAICSACYLDRGIPADAPRVETALLLGAAQILWLDVPDHAAVDLSVRLVQRRPPRRARYAGLVNAVLRRVAQNAAQHLRGIDHRRRSTRRTG